MDIEAQLRQEIERQLASGQSAIVEQFILRNGKAWQGSRRPRNVPKGKAGHCFRNAIDLALDDRKHSNLTYAEGFAMVKDAAFPLMPHAWCVDGEGRVIDNTWRNPEACVYIGVTFPMRQVREEIARNGAYGLLDTGTGLNTDLIFKIDPQLRKDLESCGRRIPPTRRLNSLAP